MSDEILLISIILAFIGFIFSLPTILKKINPFGIWDKDVPEIPLGTVEIVEIDGRYAVRQYGYYVSYGKPMAMRESDGAEPFLSGCIPHPITGNPIRIPKEPDWDYLTSDGMSSGIIGSSRTPAKWNLYSLSEAETVAEIARDRARKQFEKFEKERRYSNDYEARCERAKNAPVTKRFEV